MLTPEHFVASRGSHPRSEPVGVMPACRNGVIMPNKRYALVVRLWQVKRDCTLPVITNVLDPTTQPDLTDDPIVCRHWRGAVQVAGDPQLHYFNSLQEMNQLIAQLVNSPKTDEP